MHLQPANTLQWHHSSLASLALRCRNSTSTSDFSLKTIESLNLIRQVIDIDAVEQLVEQSQTRAIGAALGLIHQQLSRAAPQAASQSVPDIVGSLVRQMDGPQGLDAITGGRGDCARPRAFEIAAALNRVRSLSVRQLR